MYQATWDESWIDWAVELVQSMLELFSGENDGPLFFSASDVTQLIARMQDQHDSSVPSGNAMAAMALLRLGAMTGNTVWIDRARKIAESSASLLARAPIAAGQIGCVIADLVLDPPHLVLATGDAASRDAALKTIRSEQTPVLFIATHIDGEPVNDNLAGLFQERGAMGGKPTLYVCRGTTCESPAVGLEEIANRFGG